ncbi:MAG: sigma-70 family RNA polymerase sigma factor [Candidatus Eisenbacteria bacterium]|nr:sigma-70 family RNA polymerase sigma factor [Candidatus Eisenbacteria bacterium]
MRNRGTTESAEARLVERLRRADSDAWTEFIERYRRLIWSAIHRVNARYNARWDDTTMDDLFEESLLKLLRDNGKALAAWEGRCKLETWIYRIARNVCIDQLRKETRRARARERSEERSVRSSGSGGVDGAARDATDLRMSLDEAIERCLSPREALAVRLIYLEGFTYREVAGRLDMTVGALSGFVYRALAKLRERGGLERDW